MKLGLVLVLFTVACGPETFVVGEPFRRDGAPSVDADGDASAPPDASSDASTEASDAAVDAGPKDATVIDTGADADADAEACAKSGDKCNPTGSGNCCNGPNKCVVAQDFFFRCQP